MLHVTHATPQIQHLSHSFFLGLFLNSAQLFGTNFSSWYFLIPWFLFPINIIITILFRSWLSLSSGSLYSRHTRTNITGAPYTSCYNYTLTTTNFWTFGLYKKKREKFMSILGLSSPVTFIFFAPRKLEVQYHKYCQYEYSNKDQPNHRIHLFQVCTCIYKECATWQSIIIVFMFRKQTAER